MRRSIYLVLGLFAGAASFSACRDAAVAPTENASAVELNVPQVALSELAASQGGIRFWVTLDPRRTNTYSDGINAIRIPAGAICDPATSSYGPAHWDEPCVAATSPITLPVTLSMVNRRIVIHFGKDLRFMPSADPERQVQLVVNAPAVKSSTEPLSAFNILWIPSDQDRYVDESVTDPSLATIVDRSQGRIIRRLKHFSGYYVHLGRSSECEVGVDEGCVARDGAN